MNENNETTTIQNTLNTTNTLADLCIAIGRVGEPLGGKWGYRTDLIGQIGEELSHGKDIGEILSTDDVGREVAGIIGAAIGGVIGAGLGGFGGGVAGALVGGIANPVGAVFGYIAGGAFGAALGGYVGSDVGEYIGEGIYDFFDGLPDQDNLTDAQREELAAMVTAGGMPWDYHPNGEDSGFDVGDFLDNIGNGLSDLLDSLSDSIDPSAFIDELLGSLQATLPGGLASLFGDLIDGISAEINELWEFAQNWKPFMSPLVLDLDGDGVETFGITADTQVLFDHDGDGIKTATGWVSSDDGILVLDRNGNGLIDNGGELFGDQTIVNGVKAKNGFEALSAEDTNIDRRRVA